MTDELAVYNPPTPAATDPGSPEGVAWFDATLRQAEYLAGSEIVPAAYRNKPADIVVAAMYGRDFGWSATMAMTHIHVVEGKPSLSAQSMVALVRGAGHSISGDSTSTGAKLTGTRKDTGDTLTVEFTVWDAARAGMCTVNADGVTHARSQYGKPKPWEMYPQAMCWARAVSQLCRMLFADVLMGLSYTPEELEGIPAASTEDGRSEDDLERDRMLAGLQARIAELDAAGLEKWVQWKQASDGWYRSVTEVRRATDYVLSVLANQGVEPFPIAPSAGGTGAVVDETTAPEALTNNGGNDTESDSVQSDVADGVVREMELALTGDPDSGSGSPLTSARRRVEAAKDNR